MATAFNHRVIPPPPPPLSTKKSRFHKVAASAAALAAAPEATRPAHRIKSGSSLTGTSRDRAFTRKLRSVVNSTTSRLIYRVPSD